MPALKAIITGDATQLAAVMKQVETMSKNAGVKIQQNLMQPSGGGYSGSSGIIRETLVLLREISRGNWNRVPGSLSILAQRLGIIDSVAKGAVTTLGAFGIALTVAAAAAYAGYWAFTKLTKALTGLELPNFNPEYIAKHLQGINAAAEGQKKINQEVARTIELYNGAAQASERAAKATKEHYEHLRRMAALEKDPQKRAAAELEVDQQERKAELANQYASKLGFDIEAKQKKAAADAIHVASKEYDGELLKKRKSDADAAQKYLDNPNQNTTLAIASVIGDLRHLGIQSTAEINAARESNKSEAHQLIKAYKYTVEKVASNDELRKRKGELTNDAAAAAVAATKAGLNLPGALKSAAQSDADEKAENAARLADEKAKARHGHVTSLQQIGAYTTGAVDVQRQQLRVLHKIEANTGHLGNGGGGKTKF